MWEISNKRKGILDVLATEEQSTKWVTASNLVSCIVTNVHKHNTNISLKFTFSVFLLLRGQLLFLIFVKCPPPTVITRKLIKMTVWMYLSTFHDVVKLWRDVPVDGPGAQTCSWQSISWQTCHEHVCGNEITETVQRRLRKTWSYTKSGGEQKGIFWEQIFPEYWKLIKNLPWEALFENDTGMPVKIERAAVF